MAPGDEVRVSVRGQTRAGGVVRIIDRRGGLVPMIRLDPPPPYTTVVIEPCDGPGERICVPLWIPDGEVRLVGLHAAYA